MYLVETEYGEILELLLPDYYDNFIGWMKSSPDIEVSTGWFFHPPQHKFLFREIRQIWEEK